MALFSQDDEEKTPQSAAPDFSGGPVDPDSEDETPSPVEPSGQQDTPEVVPVDDAADYSQPVEQPETQGQDLAGIQVGSEDGAAQYAVQGQPVPGMNDPNGPVPQPTYDPYQTYADHSADYAAMQAQKAKEALQNVKPSVGRRILAGLAGGAVAFGGGDGGAVVEKVLNRPAQQAQQQWQRDEAPIQAKIGADQAQDAATQRANQGINANNAVKERNYRTQVVGQYDQGRVANAAAAAYQKSLTLQPVDPKNPFGEWQQVDPTGKVVARGQEPPNSVKNDPQYKAQQDANEITARQTIAAGNPNLKPGSEAYNNFVYKTPMTTHTNISLREGGAGNGQPKPMTQAQKDVILQAKQRDMTATQNQMASGILSPKDGAAQMQSIQDTFEQKIGVDPDSPAHMTVNPDFTWSRGGQRVASPAAPAQAAPRAQQAPQQQAGAFQYKGQTFTPGQRVMVNGKPAVVKGINPQTGKLIVGAQ